MENDIKEGLERRRSNAWSAFRPLKRVTDYLVGRTYDRSYSDRQFSLRSVTRWLRGSILLPRETC